MKFGSKRELKLYCGIKLKYGFTILRKGWPDFIIEKKNGDILCIEVKSTNGHLKQHQQKVFSLLKKAGIPCYISRNGELNDEILEELEK